MIVIGRLYKKSIYDRDNSDPHVVSFSVEGSDVEEILKNAQRLSMKAEMMSASSFIVKQELEIDDKWEEYDMKGFLDNRVSEQSREAGA